MNLGTAVGVSFFHRRARGVCGFGGVLGVMELFTRRNYGADEFPGRCPGLV